MQTLSDHNELERTHATVTTCIEKSVLTKSDLEWNRNSRILVPIAPLGGSSNAVKARVDKMTFKGEQEEVEKVNCLFSTNITYCSLPNI